MVGEVGTGGFVGGEEDAPFGMPEVLERGEGENGEVGREVELHIGCYLD